MKSLKSKGMGYLRGAENDLSSFSKFVQKADSILKKLRVSSSKISSKENTVASSDNPDNSNADSGEGADDQFDERKEQTPRLPSTRYLLFIEIVLIRFGFGSIFQTNVLYFNPLTARVLTVFGF